MWNTGMNTGTRREDVEALACTTSVCSVFYGADSAEGVVTITFNITARQYSHLIFGLASKITPTHRTPTPQSSRPSNFHPLLQTGLVQRVTAS